MDLLKLHLPQEIEWHLLTRGITTTDMLFEERDYLIQAIPKDWMAIIDDRMKQATRPACVWRGDMRECTLRDRRCLECVATSGKPCGWNREERARRIERIEKQWAGKLISRR